MDSTMVKDWKGESQCSIEGSLWAGLCLEVVAWGVDAVGRGLAVVLSVAPLVAARDGVPDFFRARVQVLAIFAAVAAAGVEGGAWALRLESMLLKEGLLGRLFRLLLGAADVRPRGPAVPRVPRVGSLHRAEGVRDLFRVAWTGTWSLTSLALSMESGRPRPTQSVWEGEGVGVSHARGVALNEPGPFKVLNLGPDGFAGDVNLVGARPLT